MNFDVLRSICCMMVVLLHTCGLFTKDYAKQFNYPNYFYSVANFYLFSTRIAVPCFVMMGGWFAINKKTNVDGQSYIKSRLNKIAKPTILFALIYACYDVIVSIIKSSSFDIQMFEPILKIIANPYHHLWYAYMITCMYLVVPYLIPLLNQIGRYKFRYFSLMMMILGMIMDYTCQLSWPMLFIKYLGYFCMGWTIKDFIDTNPKMRHYHFLRYGLLFLFILFIEYEIRDVFALEDVSYFGGNFDILVILSSMLIYAHFCKSEIKIKKFLPFLIKVSQMSFYIYLIHYGVLLIVDNILEALFSKYFIIRNPIWYIPLTALAVWSISYIGASMLSHTKSKGVSGSIYR